MHRYRIVAQISLILSILNLVLAAPIVVQEIHEARGDEMVVAEDVAAMPKKWRESEAALDRSTSPRSDSSPDAMASPQHSPSPDGSTSSSYPAPYLSSDTSVSGYSWLLDRPPRLSPNNPASLHESASPHPSSLGSPQPWWLQWFAPEISPHHSSAGSSEVVPELAPPLAHSSSSMSSEMTPPSPPLTESDRATTETSNSSPHHLTSDGSPPSPSPPTETPPDNAEFFNKNMMKKLKIVAGVAIVSGIIATIVGSQIKHRDFQDS